MKRQILLLCLLIHLSASQTVEDVLKSLQDLTFQAENYKPPTNYSEFYYDNIINEGLYAEYDFIIIGGGTAGTLLANRLSEISSLRILLLEAGHNETLYTDIPSMAGLLQVSNVNWGYLTTPQKTCCLGMNNNQCVTPRGKVLGGSSAINYMVYSRGNKADYDNWFTAGNPGWSYEDVLPYLIQVENSSLTENVDPLYHGTHGTLHVEHVRNFGDLGQGFLDANVELGRRVLDYNGHNEMGFSRIQSNTINGRRCSGNKAFLNSATMRDNLEIITGAFVTKLYIETGTINKVTSVEFLLGDKKYYATSKYEIILSAGAVGSPQILLHSGIGPEEDLQYLDIPLIQDLPVGKNLHDHPVVIYPFLSNYTDPAYKPIDQMVSDYLNGFGYLTAAGNLQSVGFINSSNNFSKVPDLEQFVSTYFQLGDDALKVLFNLQNEIHDDLMNGFGNSSGIHLQVLLHPKSRGSIKLKSKNVFDHPLIDYNYFSNPGDLEPMVRGLKYLFSLSDTNALKRFNVTIPFNPLRTCPQSFLSDEYLRCYIRHITSTLYHQAGTCKMGPDSDPEAVVDARLKVKGFENLRVIDASIMPEPLSGHPTATTYVIAAKGADMIKEDWHIQN